MKTLCRKQEEDDEQRSSMKKKKKKVSFPMEIIEDIVSRLPVKSILRSRSVSKPWRSLISHHSFNKLQFTRATESHRTGFFISAYDDETEKRYYFSAAKDGGPLTLLMKIDEDLGTDLTGPSQLNGGGLMCFNSLTDNPGGIHTHAFVVNPATRRVFRVPDMNSPEYSISGYLCCFDESRNELKILLMRKVFKTEAYEFMIFSMSSFSWRTIDAEPPVGFDWGRLGWGLDGGICVNSMVFIMLDDMSFDILAFNFVTEKFSVISLPQGVFPHGDVYFNIPHITKIDGCLALVVHELKTSQVHIWLLKNYVWVKETIIELPESWNMTIHSWPLSIDVNMDDQNQIVFNVSKVTESRVTVPVYNRKTKQFKTLEFILDDQFASVTFHHIKCYVETILPLSDNWSIKSHGQSE